MTAKELALEINKTLDSTKQKKVFFTTFNNHIDGKFYDYFVKYYKDEKLKKLKKEKEKIEREIQELESE